MKRIEIEKLITVENEKVASVAGVWFVHSLWCLDEIEVGRFYSVIHLSLRKYPQSRIELVYRSSGIHGKESFTCNMPAKGSFEVNEENEALAFYSAAGWLFRNKNLLEDLKESLKRATSNVKALIDSYKSEKC